MQGHDSTGYPRLGRNRRALHARSYGSNPTGCRLNCPIYRIVKVRSLASKDEGGRMKAENALRSGFLPRGVVIRHDHWKKAELRLPVSQGAVDAPE